MLTPAASNSTKKKEKRREEEDERKPTQNWSSDDFPWAKKLKEFMHNLFNAPSFRFAP
jgi:hypothetical protein